MAHKVRRPHRPAAPIGMAKPRRGDADPIADYVEWTANRYNPGYYLGGRIPPYLQTSRLGPKARRLAGMALGMTALVATGSIASLVMWGEEWSRLQLACSAAVVALLGWAAVRMFRSGDEHGPAATGPAETGSE